MVRKPLVPRWWNCCGFATWLEGCLRSWKWEREVSPEFQNFHPPTPVSGLCLVVVYDTGTEMAARMILKKTFPELPAGYCCKQ